MNIELVTKIVSDGRHNAFTGLAFFQGRYFVVFRSGEHHADAQGYQVIMTSSTGREWEVVHRKSFFAAGESGAVMDYRDSYFLNLGHELRLYSFSTPFDSAGERDPRHSRSTVQITRDGMNWSEPQVICTGTVLWKPIFWNNHFWCAGYRREPHPGPLVTEFLSSPDGLAWTSLGTITKGNESALFPLPNGLRAFVRTNKAPYHLEIWESRGEFQEWNKVGVIPKSIQAPHVLALNGACYLFGREVPATTPEVPAPSSALRRTKGWKIEGTEAVEVLELPSSGDTSYVGTAVGPDGCLLLSYYSQHEIKDPNPSVDDANIKPADLFVASVTL